MAVQVSAGDERMKVVVILALEEFERFLISIIPCAVFQHFDCGAVK